MNAKKCKKLRKFVRDNSAKAALRALMVGKTTKVEIPIWLDFKAANGIAEIVAELMTKDLVKDSPDVQRLAGLADLMAQYNKAINKLFTPEDIAAGVHEHHKHIRVTTNEYRITAINHPQSARGILRQAKALFARVEKSIGKARAKV
jgi:hypothetical protein